MPRMPVPLSLKTSDCTENATIILLLNLNNFLSKEKDFYFDIFLILVIWLFNIPTAWMK